MSTTAILSVALLLSGCSYAAILSSPEPMVDPLSRARLVVLPAGGSTEHIYSERVLLDGARICPEDYPTGFTVRCDVADDKRAAVQFFVDGMRVGTGAQGRLIAGMHATTGAANAWRTEMRNGEIKCRYGVSEEVYARVRIEC